MDKNLDIDLDSLDYLSELRAEYEEYKFLCECAVRNLTARLTNLQEEMRLSTGYSPIKSVESRIKSFTSTRQKLKARGAKSIYELQDIGGVRIITLFDDDVDRVVKMLRAQRSIEVVKIKDYIKDPKPNGYQSFHMIVNVVLHLSDPDTEFHVPIEIQIRSAAMDLWSAWDHAINYKKDCIPEIADEFVEMAEGLGKQGKKAMEARNKAGIHPATTGKIGQSRFAVRQEPDEALKTSAKTSATKKSTTKSSTSKAAVSPKENTTKKVSVKNNKV